MSAHPADSRLFGHLWSTAESRALFDDEGRVQSWLQILATLAQAQADVGLVPRTAADVIGSHAQVERIDLDLVAEQTRASGHSTMGLIRALRATLPDSAREWVYYGATVQDLSDTWTALMCRAIGDVMVRDVTAMRDLAGHLARRHRDTPMCGRTHGQPGLPITFGFKAAVWASELDRHLVRLAQGRPRWEVAQLGGALGTMEFWGEHSVDLLQAFASRLELGAPEICWLTARDRVAEFVCLLAATSATVAKIGNEVFQLQRPEIGEVREGFRSGTVGSITMPHKRNPENSEQLVTLSRVIRAQAGLALEGIVSEHERDGRAWKTEWLLLPEACLAFSASCALGVDMLEGLQIDTERMSANLASHQGYLMSEPVLRALSDRLGKHTAHDVVYEASMTGIEAGQDFLTALRADRRLDVIADEELRGLLDMRGALGSAGQFVDRVLAGFGPLMTVTDDVHNGLARVSRVQLAVLPTSLHLAPRLSDELGVPVWFKRDDLTGIGLGGNKVRALEYLLADALDQDCDCLVTGAGSQSNWTMLAALAGVRCGLEPFVVCYGDPVPNRGNLLLHRQIGSTISFTGDPERSSVDGAIERLATELRDRGRRPYVIPRGGATPVGALGYLRASVELAGQLSAVLDPPRALWLPVGSGGTCAGLLAGTALLPTSHDIVGVTVSRPVQEITAQVSRLAAGTCDLVKGMATVTKPAVDIRDGWIGPGYGLPSPEGDSAAALVACTESVFLDPVFGAKAMAALIGACRSGEVTGPVAFLVSGGAPTLFSGLADT